MDVLVLHMDMERVAINFEMPATSTLSYTKFWNFILSSVVVTISEKEKKVYSNPLM